MAQKKGSVSVSTENIFPIIRKYLYTDRDIFLRELVSNASDAIAKHRRLVSIGEAEPFNSSDYKIDITFDSEQGILDITDNGVGMTLEEIDRFINQIAFSGALDFVKMYGLTDEEKKNTSNTTSDDGNEETTEDAPTDERILAKKGAGDGIIGHFGLGFYSAFMVSSKVQIDSLSWKDNEEPARWISEDGMNFTLETVLREEGIEHRGTRVRLFLDDTSKDFVNASSIRSILNKYCNFMPWPIFFTDLVSDRNQKNSLEKEIVEAEVKVKDLEAKLTETAEIETKSEDSEENNFDKELEDAKETLERKKENLQAIQVQRSINNTEPLWLKSASDLKDEDYEAFYQSLFHNYKKPLFWIHLNMDYPFRLRGILYFPQREEKLETLDGRIKLYYNQVFVADNMKGLIPEFLFLLQGAIDCPDLPLNVSRSGLQDEIYIKKLSDHILRKVADKLKQLEKSDRTAYEKNWKDLSLFARYGYLTQPKFADRVAPAMLFACSDGSFLTFDELPETVYYTEDMDKQFYYVKRQERLGNKVVIMDSEIDSHYLQSLKYKDQTKKFLAVDVIDADEKDEKETESLLTFFASIPELSKLKVKRAPLGAEELPAVLLESEQQKSIRDFQKQYGAMMGSMMGDQDLSYTLVLNTDHNLVSKLETSLEMKDKEDDAKKIATHLYDLARLAHGSLEGEAMQCFLKRSVDFLSLD